MWQLSTYLLKVTCVLVAVGTPFVSARQIGAHADIVPLVFLIALFSSAILSTLNKAVAEHGPRQMTHICRMPFGMFLLYAHYFFGGVVLLALSWTGSLAPANGDLRACAVAILLPVVIWFGDWHVVSTTVADYRLPGKRKSSHVEES